MKEFMLLHFHVRLNYADETT